MITEDYKEKYEQAFKRAKDLHDNHALGMPFIYETCEQIFPELKDSEDERIRKGLIDFLNSPFINENITDEKVAPWIAWLEKQGEQKHICKLDNSYAHVRFPFKAKVKSTDKIVTIHGGQLSLDGKEWIKYQSDFEDGYKIYEPNDLELVCEIEQKHAWSEEDEIKLKTAVAFLKHPNTIDDNKGIQEKVIDWLKSLKERIKGE